MSDIQYRLWIADLLGNLHILLGLFPQKNGLIWKFVSLKGCVWAKKKDAREISSQIEPTNPVNYQKLSNRIYNFLHTCLYD
jgi:hypothetical protein